MTETERKALALVNEVLAELEGNWTPRTKPFGHEAFKALCRAIEQHEAFRREVSDAVADAEFMIDTHCDEEALTLFSNRLSRFILPKPVDPLTECFVEAFKDSRVGELDGYWAIEAKLRAALAARGLEIREVKP